MSCEALWATTSTCISVYKAYWNYIPIELYFENSFSFFSEFKKQYGKCCLIFHFYAHIWEIWLMRPYNNLFKYPIVNVQKRGMSYWIWSNEYVFRVRLSWNANIYLQQLKKLQNQSMEFRMSGTFLYWMHDFTYKINTKSKLK